jgi:hypothetical protein
MSTSTDTLLIYGYIWDDEHDLFDLVVELAAQADYRSTEDRRFDEEGGARS